MRLVIALVVLLWPVLSPAQTVTVGLFAPTAPFPSTSARVELASRLGEHVGKRLGVGGAGKVFARGADFAAAVKKGEVTVALVDAVHLAIAGGNYTVIAAAVRGGETSHGWQLVARGVDKLSGLRGKRVLVPGIGGRESDLVLSVLFAGEVSRDYFAKIETAPDTVSALAALGLGKADAAIVPTGVDLPGGTSCRGRCSSSTERPRSKRTRSSTRRCRSRATRPSRACAPPMAMWSGASRGGSRCQPSAARSRSRPSACSSAISSRAARSRSSARR
jgi:hypothetical protein